MHFLVVILNLAERTNLVSLVYIKRRFYKFRTSASSSGFIAKSSMYIAPVISVISVICCPSNDLPTYLKCRLLIMSRTIHFYNEFARLVINST